MLDVAGFELDAEDREVLQHPLVGGLILFTRNYHDPQQLAELVRQVRSCRQAPLLIAVDHEGGRVQRFREGFSRIPSMASLLQHCNGDPEQAAELAVEMGWLMAVELNALDIDISFAPVLDINGVSRVIGERSFSSRPEEIVTIASGFVQGMQQTGMLATGKHFPGHGNVLEDSHVDMPEDHRDAEAIYQQDMWVFQQLIEQSRLAGVMAAHVVYPKLDTMPAGFSRFWMQQMLREKLGFTGAIFTDDLSMQGAAAIGDYPARARAALSAGCDMALACNNRDGAVAILDSLQQCYPLSQAVQNMLNPQKISWKQLPELPRWQQAQHRIGAMNHA